MPLNPEHSWSKDLKLPWAIKIRIMVVMAVGAAAMGVLCWPLAAPADPLAPVSLLLDGTGWPNAAIIAAAAFVTGLAGYLAAWPYGGYIAVLAVPSALAVWALRSGSVAVLMQQHDALERHAVFATLKWEPLLWLGVVAVGYAATKLADSTLNSAKTSTKRRIYTSASFSNALLAILGSTVASQLCITLLAQDVRLTDQNIGSLVGQPVIGQIAFAVLVTFGLVAFAAKKLLNVGCVWPAIATALVPLAAAAQLKTEVVQMMVERWPAVFFPNAVLAVAPVQMVAFGTLGSIAGYWLALRHQKPE